jgi:hypothetical protein
MLILLTQIFDYFLFLVKNIIFYFVKFVATKKGKTANFFPPSSFLLFLDP